MQLLDCGKLVERPQVGLLETFRGTVGCKMPQSVSTGNGGYGRNLAESGTLVAEIAESGVDHTCEPHNVGLHGRYLLIDLQFVVAVTDSGDMEVHIHATHAADKVTQMLGCFLVCYINPGIENAARIFFLKLLHHFDLAPGYAYKHSVGGKPFGHIQPDSRCRPHDNHFLHNTPDLKD